MNVPNPNLPPEMGGAEGYTTHAAYSFACLSCGYGWEQKFSVEHLRDPHGRPVVEYYVGGKQVRSPLTYPTCPNCDGHRVRVMRPGRVAAVRRARG
ncbi:hypothetical protein SUDANB171_03590 [Streptomyces sp. enrichment culture]|jgi:hypothetical protein|uniref:hypothetical protein n=1 Tax=Streptomyces xiamenensis TaxID=408015 RepID=UPI0036E9377A